MDLRHTWQMFAHTPTQLLSSRSLHLQMSALGSGGRSRSVSLHCTQPPLGRPTPLARTVGPTNHGAMRGVTIAASSDINRLGKSTLASLKSCSNGLVINRRNTRSPASCARNAPSASRLWQVVMISSYPSCLVCSAFVFKPASCRSSHASLLTNRCSSQPSCSSAFVVFELALQALLSFIFRPLARSVHLSARHVYAMCIRDSPNQIFKPITSSLRAMRHSVQLSKPICQNAVHLSVTQRRRKTSCQRSCSQSLVSTCTS